ncbi:MAG TPA: DMT family transporter [Vitreimonas sp.]|nr:DMT family transporter [Vitreimonas sp.]
MKKPAPFAQQPRAATSPPRWHSYGFLLLNTLVWSAAFILVKPAYEVTTPFRFLMYRFILAVALSVPLLLHYWPRVRPSFKTVAIICGLEIIGTTFSLSLIYLALKYSTVIVTNLLTTPMPIFITLASLWLLKEKEERHEWIGLSISFLGTLGLVIYPLFLTTANQLAHASLLGAALVLLHIICNAIYWPFAKLQYAALPKLFVSTISFYVGALSFFLLSWGEMQFSLPSLIAAVHTDLGAPTVWYASVYMALFGSIIGLTAYIKGQDGIEASEASLFAYLSPLISIPLAVIVLGETFHTYQLISLIVILCGVVIAEHRTRQRRRTSTHHHHLKKPHLPRRRH